MYIPRAAEYAAFRTDVCENTQGVARLQRSGVHSKTC